MRFNDKHKKTLRRSLTNHAPKRSDAHNSVAAVASTISPHSQQDAVRAQFLRFFARLDAKMFKLARSTGKSQIPKLAQHYIP